MYLGIRGYSLSRFSILCWKRTDHDQISEETRPYVMNSLIGTKHLIAGYYTTICYQRHFDIFPLQKFSFFFFINPDKLSSQFQLRNSSRLLGL